MHEPVLRGKKGAPMNEAQCHGGTQGPASFQLAQLLFHDLGLQRVGGYVYRGESPTFFLTSGGAPIPGTGRGNRPFYRAGAYGIWYIHKLDFSTLYMHGKDNVFLGTGTPANQPMALPPGAQAPTWNGGFVETHYTWSPQLTLVARYEAIRLSRQAFPIGTPLMTPGGNRQPRMLRDRLRDGDVVVWNRDAVRVDCSVTRT